MNPSTPSVNTYSAVAARQLGVHIRIELLTSCHSPPDPHRAGRNEIPAIPLSDRFDRVAEGAQG
jgi:hypothetical protein